MKRTVRSLSTAAFVALALSVASAQDAPPAVPGGAPEAGAEAHSAEALAAEVAALNAQRDAALARVPELEGQVKALKAKQHELRAKLAHHEDDELDVIETRVRNIDRHIGELVEWIDDSLVPLVEGRKAPDAGTPLGQAASERDAALLKARDLGREVARLTSRTGEMSQRLELPRAEYVKSLEALEADLSAQRGRLRKRVEDDLLPKAEALDPKLAALKEDAASMAQQVEKIRGLEFVRPFMRRLVRREDVGRWMRRDLERDLPQDEADRIVAVMSEFGVVPKGTDLYAMNSEFLEAGAAAYYKPETDTFYLIEGNDGIGSRPIVFHELVHAVEDQHYALDEMSAHVDEDSDGGMAFKGLVEGSADFFQDLYQSQHKDEVAAMMKDQMTPDMIQRQRRMVQQVPTFFIAAMAFYPYKGGSAFLRGVGVTGPEQADAVWADPPVSTEQVLHPGKFALDGKGRDYPHKVAAFDLSPVLGDSWEQLETASMGELMTGLTMVHLKFPEPGMFQQRLLAVINPATGGLLLKPPVSTAVAGWDGDRYVAMQEAGTGEVCVAWTSVWDSEKDAAEFAQEFGRLLTRKVNGELPESIALPLRLTESGTGQITGIDLAGTRVTVVLGAPADAAAKLFATAEGAEITADPRDANDAPK